MVSGIHLSVEQHDRDGRVLDIAPGHRRILPSDAGGVYTPGEDLWGALDGIFHVTGFNNSSENYIEADDGYTLRHHSGCLPDGISRLLRNEVGLIWHIILEVRRT